MEFTSVSGAFETIIASDTFACLDKEAWSVELMDLVKNVSSIGITTGVGSGSAARSTVRCCCSDGDCFVASVVEKKTSRIMI